MAEFCLRLVGREAISEALEDRVGELFDCEPFDCEPCLWSRDGQVFLEFDGEGTDREAAICILEDAGIPVVTVNG